MNVKELKDKGEITIRIIDPDTGEVTERPFNFDVFCRRFDEIIDTFMNSGELQDIGEFIGRIIWTTSVDTAATDGIRIYFNPLFANSLLNLTAAEAKAQREDFIKRGIDPKSRQAVMKNGQRFDFLFENSKCLIFIIVHECYHQLYRHLEAEKMFPKTSAMTGTTHEKANICQDIEINRDIEFDFPKFQGCTKKSGGIWEAELFPEETWTEIYEKKYDDNGNCMEGEDFLPPPVEIQPPGGEQPPIPPGGGDDGKEPESLHAPEDYKNGWDAALDAIKAGNIDPEKFQPLAVDPNKFDHKVFQGMMYDSLQLNIKSRRLLEFNQDEFNQGFNDCVRQWINNMNGGEDGGGGGQPPVQWDNLENPPSPPSKNNQNSNGNSSGSGPSDEEIENMSEKDAADSAQKSANKAQQAANKAQQAASQAQQKASQAQQQAQQSGSSSDQAAADKAQQDANAAKDAASKAQDAASKAQEAADRAQQAAGAGDNAEAQEAAKEARDAANEAQEAANEAAEAAENASNNQSSKKLGQGQKAFKGEQGASSNISTSPQSSEQGSSTPEVVEINVRKRWGGMDRISKEQGMKISQQEGIPFDNEELSDTPEERNKKIFERVLPSIEGSHGQAGKEGARSLASRLRSIQKALNPSIINWHSLLAKIFKSAGLDPKTIYKKRTPRFGGSIERPDRFVEDKKKNRIAMEYDAADVFYLIDNSGSISRNILFQTLSEVIGLEKKSGLNIKKSALTYFSTDIDESRIRVWYPDTPKRKILDMAVDQEGEMTGGTAIARSVVAVTRLSKKFYSKRDPNTVIIVFTDAEDSDWVGVKKLPPEIKKNLVFIVMNLPGNFDNLIPPILDAGIPDRHIIPVDTTRLERRK